MKADLEPESAIERYGNMWLKNSTLTRSLKVVLDMGNGSACTMASFYQKLGFDSFVINDTMDGLFPGRGPAPNEETLRPACQEVLKNHADYGVGFDPDADRGIVIDDHRPRPAAGEGCHHNRPGQVQTRRPGHLRF